MSLFEGFERMLLVRTGPGLGKRLEELTARAHHLLVVSRLRRYRRTLEREMGPESWTELKAPAVLVLAEVCGTLGFSERERRRVIGSEGERALAEIIEDSGVTYVFPEPINERQLEALRHAERFGKIDHRTYRALCPLWSDETLRLDLADLVRRGLLVKNGRKKGTFYTPGR